MLGTKPKEEFGETTIEVLGKRCKKVTIIWKAGQFEYYYNSEYLKMDSSLFLNYNYDGWYQFLKKSNSLPLRIVKKVGGMIITTMDLIEVNEVNVNDSVFELPKMKLDEELSELTPENQKVYKIGVK